MTDFKCIHNHGHSMALIFSFTSYYLGNLHAGLFRGLQVGKQTDLYCNTIHLQN